jgi:N-methylhydantoinase A
MQFQGQSHILPVALTDRNITLAQLRAVFEAAYWQRFGVELPEIRPVLVNLHTAVIGKRHALSLQAITNAQPRATLLEAQRGRRAVWFDMGWVDTPIYVREYLPQGIAFDGPAIIEQLDCTTVVEPGNRVQMDAIGNLIITI